MRQSPNLACRRKRQASLGYSLKAGLGQATRHTPTPLGEGLEYVSLDGTPPPAFTLACAPPDNSVRLALMDRRTMVSANTPDARSCSSEVTHPVCSNAVSDMSYLSCTRLPGGSLLRDLRRRPPSSAGNARSIRPSRITRHHRLDPPPPISPDQVVRPLVCSHLRPPRPGRGPHRLLRVAPTRRRHAADQPDR